MKTSILTFLFLLPFFGTSQQFEESQNYGFNDISELITDDYLSTPDSIRPELLIEVKEKSSGKVVKKIDGIEAETYVGFWVKEMKVTGFKNIKSTVKVSLEHAGCCSRIQEDYYLVTTSGKWVSLPSVEWFTCDWPDAYPSYGFKKNQHEVIQEIQKVTHHRNSQGEIYKTVNLPESYLWNGKFIVKKED